MNIVMTGLGEFVEVQGTAEGQTFNRQALNSLLDLAQKGIAELIVQAHQARHTKLLP
jgi:ribonuclease PH